MTEFMNTPLSFAIWKDLLPEVKTNENGVPFVVIPDPDNPGETIHFLSIPGDHVADLYNLAGAYLALAQHQERKQS